MPTTDEILGAFEEQIGKYGLKATTERFVIRGNSFRVHVLTHYDKYNQKQIQLLLFDFHSPIATTHSPQFNERAEDKKPASYFHYYLAETQTALNTDRGLRLFMEGNKIHKKYQQNHRRSESTILTQPLSNRTVEAESTILTQPLSNRTVEAEYDIINDTSVTPAPQVNNNVVARNFRAARQRVIKPGQKIINK
ncbi:MAG: hypothetical protein ACPGUD_04615 [Parashewanella sp.]